MVGAELTDVGLGPGQAGCGAPALLSEDLGDGGVVVVPGQAAHQVQGFLAGDTAVPAGLRHRYVKAGARAALPDDPHVSGAFPAIAGVLDGHGNLGDDGPQ